MSGSSFHEDFDRVDEVKNGSDRGFGLTVGGILLLIAAVRALLHWSGVAGIGWFELVLGAVGVALIGFGLVLPGSLGGLHRAWIKLGLVLFKVVNPVVLGVIYVTTVVPIGVVMRLLGHDPLKLKRDPKAESYWVEREPPGPAPETMSNQF